MFNFIKKRIQKAKIRAKIDKINNKADLLRAKEKFRSIKTKEKVGKYAFVLKDLDAQKELADKILEDYDNGGWEKILEMPLVQQLIQSLIMKQKGEGIPIGGREKKIQEIINALPPGTVEDVLKKIKK